MECKFSVGQKVVCIKEGKRTPGRDIKNDLTVGSVYTITKIEMYQFNPTPAPGIYLQETKRIWRYSILDPVYDKEVPWPHTLFKPPEETSEKESEAILLFRRITDGVTKGQPIVDDPVYSLEEA